MEGSLSPATSPAPSDFGSLTLTRRVGESIQIGDDVRIRVVHCTGGRVRFHIQAPRAVRVVRTELIEEFNGQS